MPVDRGFIRYEEHSGRYSINPDRTFSLVVGDYLLKEITEASCFIRGKLLDVGCGNRPYSLIYDQLTESSVGTEVSFSPYGLDNTDVICSADRLPFRTGAFDTVLLTEVLEHTKAPIMCLSECARVLKPEGCVLLSTPFLYPLHDWPHDYWRFTRYGLEEMCRASGLAVLYVHAKGGVGATIVSLWTQVLVRATDGATRYLRLRVPLRKARLVRWLLLLPSVVYLWLADKVRLPASVREKAEWMTPGFFSVARKLAQSGNLSPTLLNRPAEDSPTILASPQDA